MRPTIRSRARTRAAAAVLAITLLPLSALPTVAVAEEVEPAPFTVSDGTLDWGVKASFRNYINGPIAKGSIATSDGATVNGDGTFAFPLASGDGDAATGDVELRFEGTVTFEGHAYDGADPLLFMTVSDPHVVVTGTSAVLHADVTSKALTSGEVEDYPGVALAELDADAIPTLLAEGANAWEEVPAELTEDGVPAFANFYSGGRRSTPST